eukprot:CAMPEP_0185025820 /NCGR_PEP_ID=MMETSP1103-20130426/9394_1 /TAXON_ID=36769 /ORGANISM="Paraphysomonas bandaiensis, Strain Caron Lab Isolate" /LENGTH=380 /DNA_ID=CAMNT_0027559187 /DNA_START=233 /DNA_END=1375 /DNA_ORIENTATION=-
MPRNSSTMVLPGGETRCIYSYSSPFAFEVIPGDTDKVLFFFQGGGACWTEHTTRLEFCNTDAIPDKLSGVFNRTNIDNAYKDYTLVHILYCSGDIYVGDVVRSYTDRAGVPVTQKGFANAQSVLDWTVAQQLSGALAPTLTSLVIMGCSAGSIGAQVWADRVLNSLKWKNAAVIPDSYAGVFPENSMGAIFYDYGLCDIGKEFLSDDNLEKCYNQLLSLQDMTVDNIQKHPTVPFSFIQSKVDSVQLAYYMAVALSQDMDILISPTKFYAGVNEIFESYNIYDNFLAYLVDGDTHCFTPSSRFYTADAISSSDSGENSNQQMLSTWTCSFPLEISHSQMTVCEGRTLREGEVMEEGGDDNDDLRTTYCDSQLFPKKYLQV